MPSNAAVPRQLREKLDRELDAGERVAWMDTPIPRFFTPAATGAFLFGIPWTAFSIFWMCGAAGFKIPDFSEGFAFFPLFGVPFVLIGFGMLSSPLWAYRKALRTLYVITDRRAITFEGGWGTTIRSFPPDKLQDVYRKEARNGAGDVIITHRVWRDSDGDRRSQPVGFMRVRDAKDVEAMLKGLGEMAGRAEGA